LEWVLTVLFGVVIACLAFYNLKNNPAPWHDEGSNLSLAKALASDGVYEQPAYLTVPRPPEW
jgi:hypothetical protein